ncbi:hypothetical protein PTSG_08685 [Salpingoeca rosetta]|uniref:RRM domain-containing protein n=1 Tax=Salpingoeca rosetta (strain ATCC 50818 / BSB-021) TaxID=946362 RepID=F2UKD9_SALR5|nr:uncharacterized protein PTSG_08685 [Salpingoeca rosetta]EGD77588.1 hypothetical protein PTSG_08685 [Salpingoeca rosetta]|eukprot:XP_004990476.1 hypothetical protein PTSG_08685 [Salpingoeca rosetta]
MEGDPATKAVPATTTTAAPPTATPATTTNAVTPTPAVPQPATHAPQPTNPKMQRVSPADDHQSMQSSQSSGTLDSSADTPEPRNNLIINYLPPSVTESDLRELFKPFGTIKAIKIMTDRYTHKSLGYGFVEFETAEEAARAIQAMNGRQYMNKRLKVSIARPSSSSITGANLYIKNLPRTITEDQLRAIFNPFGEIISARLLYDGDVPKGIAFVRFDKRACAERAVAELNNTVPANCSQPIAVKFADTNRRSRAPSGSSAGMHQGSMMAYPSMPMPYGGGFQQPQPQPTMAPLQPGFVPMSPDMLPPSARTPYGYCLFVFNLPPFMDEDGFARLFANFGGVVSASISRKSLSQARRYGFVTMRDFGEAATAIQNLNDYDVFGYRLSVSFKSNRRNSRHGHPNSHAAHHAMAPPPPPHMYMGPYGHPMAMPPHQMQLPMQMQGQIQGMQVQGLQAMQGQAPMAMQGQGPMGMAAPPPPPHHHQQQQQPQQQQHMQGVPTSIPTAYSHAGALAASASLM